MVTILNPANQIYDDKVFNESNSPLICCRQSILHPGSLIRILKIINPGLIISSLKKEPLHTSNVAPAHMRSVLQSTYYVIRREITYKKHISNNNKTHSVFESTLILDTTFSTFNFKLLSLNYKYLI